MINNKQLWIARYELSILRCSESAFQFGGKIEPLNTLKINETAEKSPVKPVVA